MLLPLNPIGPDTRYNRKLTFFHPALSQPERVRVYI